MSRKNLMIVLVALLPTFATAQTPEEKGLEIAQAADAYDLGFGDFTTWS